MQALVVCQTPVAHQIDEFGVPNLTITIDVLVAVLAWPPRLKNTGVPPSQRPPSPSTSLVNAIHSTHMKRWSIGRFSQPAGAKKLGQPTPGIAMPDKKAGGSPVRQVDGQKSNIGQTDSPGTGHGRVLFVKD